MTDTDALETGAQGRWLVVVVACLASFVVGYNTVAATTAVVSIQTGLDIDYGTARWVVNIYMLVAAMVVAVSGRLADIFGRIRVFIAGIILFGSGSTCLVLADTVELALLGRILQGVGASTIFSTSVALVSIVMPESQRSLAVGILGASVSLGIGFGAPIAGGIIAVLDWRMIFALDVALLAIALILTIRVLRLGLVPSRRQPNTRIDYLGGGSVIVTLGAFTFVLSDGARIGWTSPLIVGLAAVTVIGAVVFSVVERRAATPLVNLEFFRRPHFMAAVLGMLATGILLNGILYFYNVFVQLPGALHYSAAQAGLSLLPLSLTMALLSFAAPRLLGPDSLRWAVIAGMLFMALGSGLLTVTNDATTYADLWWKILLVGAGLGLTFPLFPRIGLHVLPDADAGQGAGVINTALYLGTTLGVAAGGLIADRIRRVMVNHAIDTLATVPPDRSALVHALAAGDPSDVNKALSGLNAGDAEAIRAAIAGALDDTFSGVSVFLAISAALGAVACLWLLRHRYRPPPGGQPSPAASD